jgi:hypothetical protein
MQLRVLRQSRLTYPMFRFDARFGCLRSGFLSADFAPGSDSEVGAFGSGITMSDSSLTMTCAGCCMVVGSFIGALAFAMSRSS